MFVEFIGLPGVGKSHVCGRLAEKVAATPRADVMIWLTVDHEIGLGSQLAKLARAIRFSLCHPIVSWRILGWVMKTDQESVFGFVTKLTNLFSELDISDRRKGPLAKDQSVLQAVWSLMLRSSRKENWRELLVLLKPWLPEMVVHVVVNRAEYMRRLATRNVGHSLFDRLEEDCLESELDRGEALLRTLFEDWKRVVARKKDFRVDNELDADLNQVLTPFVDILAEPGCVQ
ncbi:MAG: hypothetical protein AAGA96_19440 [Verrucomicrobiota bacterium]